MIADSWATEFAQWTVQRLELKLYGLSKGQGLCQLSPRQPSKSGNTRCHTACFLLNRTWTQTSSLSWFLSDSTGSPLLPAHMYDSLGFLTPFTVRVNCLLQEICPGDSPEMMSYPDLTREWQQWCSELLQLYLLTIAWWWRIRMQQKKLHILMLHLFCDASEQAYSTIGNVEGETQDGELTARLDTSKSRVDPLKKITLPSLGLMGAVTFARPASHLIMTLKIEQKQARMWTDFMITLHYICNSAQKFVTTQVPEIQSLANPE